MSTLILGRAYDPRVGMCNVESIGGGYFRLTPDRNPSNRLILTRAQIQWRRARTAH